MNIVQSEYSIYYLSKNDNVFYVGMTSNIVGRSYVHYKKYGRDIEFNVLESYPIKSFAMKMESYWINQFYVWGFKLLNINGKPKTDRNKNRDSWVYFSDKELYIWNTIKTASDYKAISKATGYSEFQVRYMIKKGVVKAECYGIIKEHFNNRINEIVAIRDRNKKTA